MTSGKLNSNECTAKLLRYLLSIEIAEGKGKYSAFTNTTIHFLKYHFEENSNLFDF